MDKKKLSELVKEEIEKRHLSIREFAKLVDLSHPTISQILNDEKPTFETCMKLHATLGLSEVGILRVAELISPASPRTEELDRLEYLYDQLSQNNKNWLFAQIEFLLTQMN